MINLTNGLPQGPDNLIVPNGSISFQLNIDGEVIAPPYGFVAADKIVVFQFNALGLIQPNTGAAAQIYSNLELNPQNSMGLGTYYLVTFYDQNNARINKNPMWWQFQEVAGSTVDIGSMTPYLTEGNVIFYPLISSMGSGTVTSVAFVGDGTIFSATPSTPVTTSGDIVATLLPETANFVLAGPVSGSAALPTFRALTAADFPSGTITWDKIGSAIGNLVLNNTIFNTTFDQTDAALWTWANITAATSILNQASPMLQLEGNYWTGAASASSTWTIQTVFGSTEKSFLQISQSGSPAPAVVIATQLQLGQMGGTSGNLVFNGSGSGLFEFAVATNAGSVNALQLPTLGPTTSNSIWIVTSGNPIVSSFFPVGTAGQVLTTDPTGELLEWATPSAGSTNTIASGSTALGTTLIASGAKSAILSVAASGVLATDNVMADFNTDPSGITGYEPSVNGMLTIIKWCSAGFVNFYQYNNTGASITPGAVTINFRVVR